MADQDEETTHPERGRHIFEERLEREGGVFVEPQHDEVGCADPEVECGPDDYPEDPFAIEHRPGTVDDAGYSMGVELPDAGDLHLIPDRGRLRSGERAPDEEAELALGERDERDLWRRQRPLIEEDSEEGIDMPAGMDDEDAARVMDAMGAEFVEEDQADVSATGSATSGPDRGGFSEEDGPEKG